jgi:SAM-dependent MidA family methyltransferase
MSPTPLKTHLLELLRRSGPITFERYMELCLYHPEFGYYMQGSERTGVGGDFFTSADLHPIFARLIARQAAEMWETLERPRPFTWVEMGAGRGLFACDFIRWAEKALPELSGALEYIAVEPAPLQRGRIQERLAQAGLSGRVCLLANLEGLPRVTGCLFSNELVDAFPVAVVTRRDGHLREVYVAAEGEELREDAGRISDPSIAAYVARYASRLDEGFRVEVNRHAQPWVQLLAGKLARGFVLTVDYGDLAEYLYTRDRPRGTLLAYRGHTATEDFYSAPGESDMTAHVNFSALIDAGAEAGLELTGFTTQERFLLALGEANEFADLYDSRQSEVARLDARLKLKRLISPAGMGSIFKVLIQHRVVALPKLTGLKFVRQPDRMAA